MKISFLAFMRRSGVHDVALLFALAIYFVGARSLWRFRGWLARATYILGGLLLGYYEIHMQLLWLALGVAAIALAWMWPGRRTEHTASGGDSLP